MHLSDWIAVVSSAIALLAFVVGGRALQLQRAGAEDTARTQFAEIIHQLGLALGRIGYPDPSQAGTTGATNNTDAVMGEIQTLALQADAMAYPDPDGSQPRGNQLRGSLSRMWNPASPPPRPNWYEASVMAYAFGQLWDIDRSRRYWDMAMSLCSGPDAQVGPNAQIITFRSTGGFYYNTNGSGDLERARRAFDDALTILDPDVNGADLTHDKNQETRFFQARMEEQLGNTGQTARYLREAWELSTRVEAFWRRQRAQSQISSYVAYTGDPDRFAQHGGLPPELAMAVAALRAQQQAGAQQQMLGVAWQQGFAAAQQMFIAQQGPMPMPPGPRDGAAPGPAWPDRSAAGGGPGGPPPYLT